jgi:hypothetical protein
MSSLSQLRGLICCGTGTGRERGDGIGKRYHETGDLEELSAKAGGA